MRAVPPGAIGELCVTGNCLARGYLNLPEEDLKSFVHNPFQTTEERRDGTNCVIYKTGDLVRLTNNGELEYVGRNDSQVN